PRIRRDDGLCRHGRAGRVPLTHPAPHTFLRHDPRQPFAWSRLRRAPDKKKIVRPTASQTPKRIQVSAGRPAIRTRHNPIPRTGVKGENGTRNFRGRSGSRTRRMRIPIHTRTKAKSVPMFVSWTTSSMFATAAKNATKIPVRIVVTYGVRYFGWIFPNQGLRRPSRDIAIRVPGSGRST